MDSLGGPTVAYLRAYDGTGSVKRVSRFTGRPGGVSAGPPGGPSFMDPSAKVYGPTYPNTTQG